MMRNQTALVLTTAFVLAVLPYYYLAGQLKFSFHNDNNNDYNVIMTADTTATAAHRRSASRNPDTNEHGSFQPVWDDDINKTEEKARCNRYGFAYDGQTYRRRVFLGGLIADDTWHPLQAVAAEGYGIYHSVSYIESNTTQMKVPRKLRFTHGSNSLKRLKTLFGPNTRVTVDSVFIDKDIYGLEREHLQREYILYRWKINGMRPEDIGIVADTDETFTRDFMRAAQICTVPELTHNHNQNQKCHVNKIVAQTMVFETSPDCITQHRLWYHPDMALGTCIEHVGDESIHPPVTRTMDNGRTVFNEEELQLRRKHKKPFPLLKAPEIRHANHGSVLYPQLVLQQQQESLDWNQVAKKTGQPIRYNAFHFHNFFDNATTLRNKMATYGHPHPQAWELPLGALQNDIQTAINCVFNRTDKAGHEEVAQSVVGGLDAIVGPIPIMFQNKTYRNVRNAQVRIMILQDEAKYGRGSRE